MAKSTNFQVQQIPKVRQLHKIGEVGKWNYFSITYSLSNNYTKNYYNRALTLQVIVEDVVTYMDFCETQCIGLCIIPSSRR